MVWEAIFLLLILKIPVVYLGCVVWWAIRAEPEPPRPLEGALVTSPSEPEPRPGWSFLRRPSRPRRPQGGPHDPPSTYRRAPAFAKLEADE